MDLGLAGRVGLLVGAGGEIGAATARLLRAEGAEVESDPTGAVDFLVNFVNGTEFESNVMEPMRAMKTVAPLLVERSEGRIVNVVSTADPVTGAAALALSRLFADRYAKRGVLVNAIGVEPGADPDAVAREVAFLCSERASHIVGTAGVIG